MGHGDDHAGHGHAVSVGDAVLDERSIYLEAVETEPGDVGQAGEAGAAGEL